MAKLSYKVSFYVLYALFAIILIVLGLFYFVGYNNTIGELTAPQHTDTLIYLMYALIIAIVVITIAAGLAQFITALKDSPKRALKSLLGLVVLVAVIAISYAIGSDEPVTANGMPYTDTFWLKITDMFLYSIYILLGASVLATVVNMLGIFKK